MAQINVTVAGYNYALACRDGEEQHLLALGEKLNSKVMQAIGTVGTTGEVRGLLLGALLLADELHEIKAEIAPVTVAAAPEIDLAPLLRIAEQMESLANSLEN
jgi:cell division protein ZapA